MRELSRFLEDEEHILGTGIWTAEGVLSSRSSGWVFGFWITIFSTDPSVSNPWKDCRGDTDQEVLPSLGFDCTVRYYSIPSRASD